MYKNLKILLENYGSKEPLYFGPKEDKDNWFKWLKKLKPEIHADGSVSTDKTVKMYREKLTRLPFNFNSVKGDFNCVLNNLTSLEGAPKFVGGSFSCFGNELTSLEGAPEVIEGKFDSDQFTDEEYRKFVRERRIKKKLDKELDPEFDIDLKDF